MGGVGLPISGTRGGLRIGLTGCIGFTVPGAPGAEGIVGGMTFGAGAAARGGAIAG